MTTEDEGCSATLRRLLRGQPLPGCAYAEFRAAGLPVGSGVVESSCDAVGGRLKRGGMHWTVKRGANPMLALRRRWLDSCHDEFFKARARPPPMALAA